MPSARTHRYRLPLLVALLGVLLLAIFWPGKQPRSTRIEATREAATEPPQPPKPPTPASAAQPRENAQPAEGKRELQAYRLAVKNGVVSLEGSTRLTGDFHRRRGTAAWMPGMWCVRLLNGQMQVLAEETAMAPDDVCVVTDPQNLSPTTGKPQVTQFAGAGEEAMLQVRLPPHPEAKWLRVYRIASLDRADWQTEPMGKLLASISLP